MTIADKLYVVYKSIKDNWRDLFLTDTPKNVTLQDVDDNGNLVDFVVQNLGTSKKKIDDWVVGAEGKMPFSNLLKDSFMNKGVSVFSTYNPSGHGIAHELVSWDFNDVTKGMANQLHMLDGDMNPICCGILTEGGVKFVKVNITRNNDEPNVIHFVGFFGAYDSIGIQQGVFTAIIGALGCGAGSFKIAGKTLTDGVIEKSLTSVSRQNGWSHLDTFRGCELLSDNIELYVALPVLVAGDARNSVIENIAIFNQTN